jgi:hypothetical protein
MKTLSFALVLILVTGCASPHQATISPGAPVAASQPSAAPGFNLAVQEPAAVQAPPPCPGCIGLGYDGYAALTVTVTSTAYSGPIQISIAGLPAAVALVPTPIPQVTLNYGTPLTVSLTVYVLPSAEPGTYGFTVTALGQSPVAQTMPAVLTVTSGDSAWRH